VKPLVGRPLREPEPKEMGPGIAKVRVVVEATLLNGQVCTYEFHNITFDPMKALPSHLGHDRTHGIDLTTWRPEDEDAWDFPISKPPQITTQQEPEQIDLRIRGTLRPKSNNELETGNYRIVTPQEDQ